jgi:hypothetical protein
VAVRNDFCCRGYRHAEEARLAFHGKPPQRTSHTPGKEEVQDLIFHLLVRQFLGDERQEA